MDTVATRSRSTHLRRERVDRQPRVSIRPIETTDADELSVFYARLSPESRHTRFFGSAPGITDAQAGRFAAADGHARAGFVAVLHEVGPQDGAIVGHACVEPVEAGTFEMAFAVDDRLQRLGIGRRLLAAVVAWARRSGAERLTATMLVGNEAMRRLALAAGLPYQSHCVEAGTQELEFRVSA